ncbi:50S ribosomal protein L11 methyltransferase [Neolewinella lacunae]|uniref:Ribosomal protein L11 methyltransferase n=1 Tax=Neolewinella lacunae TaxID=1517758 RepID=A0A923PHM3_9BACT|nr:50S ribosomal protein L11 methyltransferase [Neolewinella lacunae]MBC6993449.1 50S ribosomal protein L11 methyltransferase [Neolewinella lacunae]MDN3636275.1 50S ribosomal protein L11 methyltransferase [Neolewinella lacunae]
MYHQYSLLNDPGLNEMLIAFLGEADFDSFQELDSGLHAFALAEQHEQSVAALEDLRERFPFTYTWEVLENKNWNEEWERQFQPIRVGERLLIRADFHPADPAVEHELVITPKMAFGTGHHATTYMMCELIFEEDLAGKSVLDYGSGTGVLAILAKRLGAGPVDAVDIEGPAAENTAENAQANGTELRHVVLGELHDVPPGPPYDLILANINRNVILATGEALYERLRPGGRVLFSGILAQDEELLLSRLAAIGFHHHSTRRREDWRAFVFSRS